MSSDGTAATVAPTGPAVALQLGDLIKQEPAQPAVQPAADLQQQTARNELAAERIKLAPVNTRRPDVSLAGAAPLPEAACA